MLLGNAQRLPASLWTISKVIVKPQGNAQRLLDSLWQSFKVYWKAVGKCPYKTDTC
jgi:hypothetical protein